MITRRAFVIRAAGVVVAAPFVPHVSRIAAWVQRVMPRRGTHGGLSSATYSFWRNPNMASHPSSYDALRGL